MPEIGEIKKAEEIGAELAKRDKGIMQLEVRLTLLEAENVLLRSENSVRE